MEASSKFCNNASYIAILQHSDCTSRTNPNRTAQIQWRRPCEGWIKLNTDDFISNSKAGYAAIIRNNDGSVVGMAHESCHQQPIHLIELRGALLGLKLATSLSNSSVKLWVEMDSNLSVNWIERILPPTTNSYTCPPLRNLRISCCCKTGNRLKSPNIKSWLCSRFILKLLWRIGISSES